MREYRNEISFFGPSCTVHLPRIAANCTKDEIFEALRRELRDFGFEEPYRIIYFGAVLDFNIAALDKLGKLATIQCWHDGEKIALWGYIHGDSDHFSMGAGQQPEWLYVNDPSRYVIDAVQV